MKKLIFATLATIAFSASAQDAYIYPGWDTVGQPIPKEDFRYVLYLKKRCDLPIGNAANMARAEIFIKPGGKPGIGCWGKTLNPTGAEVLIIDPYGNATKSAILNFAAVKFNRDGEAVVTGPALSMDEYRSNIKRFQDSQR